MKRLDTESGKSFSYSADISTLEEYYQKQCDLIKRGNEDLVTFELVMLGNALDFIYFAKKSFGIILDNQEKSIDSFEEVMDALNRGIIQKNLFQKENDISRMASAYLGFLILANFGGKWTDTENGAAVNIKNRMVYVSDFVAKRLESGTELNTVEYFKSVRLLK